MSAPTLLVGLGGTGCKVVQKVSDLVTGEQRQKLALAMFDTDINELREIQRKNPFAKTIQTSTKQTVGEYLNQDTHARDDWFPVNSIINGKTLTEGAGQVRSISRLALDTVIRADKLAPLHEAIESLNKVEEEKVDQALRVVIVSSLAGGTGSGLILPVAMYIKNYIATHCSKSANITRGFFILPEVFYEVIKGPAERNNLKANAYATLRELDAFLMKGDGTLHERYKDTVAMHFPIAASEGSEEYDVRPYDFCFLFDAQDADGKKLGSFEQYLDQAANCIYAQSIGPMNKRSNSSEDNTIRKLAKAKGRNRYAGAGVSTLIYPYEDIKKFVALQWAKECISKQWLVFDEEYKALLRAYKAREEKGIAAAMPDAGEHYMLSVESSANKNDPFAKTIIRSCTMFDSDGMTKKGNKWDEYIRQLGEKVAKDEKESAGLNKTASKIKKTIGDLAEDYSAYVSAYRSIEKHYTSVVKHLDESASTVAYNMFYASREFRTAKPESYELEYYLAGADGTFAHPNAARYFLNKTLIELKAKVEKLDTEVSDLRDTITGFAKRTFDDKRTKDVVEDVSSLEQRKGNPVEDAIASLAHKPTSEQQVFKNKFNKHLNDIEEYREKYMLREVYREGVNYVAGLLQAFELFYSNFETKVDTLDKRVDEIRTKYERKSGSTTRYICADSECLEQIYKKKQYTGSATSIDSELARKIYYSLLDYSLMEEKPNGNLAFGKIFEDDILGYYEEYVMKKYGDSIDVDIIKALEMEAVYRHPEYLDVENPSVLIDQYVKKVIEETRELSCPFIEKPLGQAQDPIYACTYSTELEQKYADDPGRSALIKTYLKNFGAVPDAEVDKHMIMFYQSFYGLRANDLGKFAPAEKSMTYNRPCGEYFKAYYELVEGIHPESHKSREISPHIDRWWHIVTKMPDLDDENQAKQEYDINAAFFWSIVNKYIKLADEESIRCRFVIDREELEMEESRLVVSNGTPCDRLYEVLDAVAIYPELRRKILANIEKKVIDDNSKNKNAKDCSINEFLAEFKVAAPGVGYEETAQAARSIFTLPYLMKKSCAPDRYYEDTVIQILKVELEEIKKYMKEFATEQEYTSVVYDIIEDQYKKFLADMKIEAAVVKGVYRESLFNQTVTIIAKTVESLGYEDAAKKMKKEVEELKDSKE